MSSYSQRLASWACALRYSDLPDTVVANTRLRVLDVIGLTLAGLDTPFGHAVRTATLALAPGGCSRIWGSGDASTVTGAAYANAAMSQALEFDDTHNRSIVHMSGPSVAAALALAEREDVSGRDLIAAIAVGNEVSCRIGSVAPGQFHRRGFHPTGLFAPFGVTCLAGRLIGCDTGQLTSALGIVGSYAAGLLQCWVDGTQSKFLHPGAAAQNAILAATQGRSGATGPTEIIEGRFGLLAAHLQDDTLALDYGVLAETLGQHWESESASFKPFPAAHVIHPYIDALLRLRHAQEIRPEDVARIVCPVPEYIVGIVCEPTHEKRRPQSDSHGRVSLQYTLAEALVLDKLDKNAYAPASRSDPRILGLADLVEYRIDDSFPGPEQFKGEVRVELRDGRTFTETEPYNRGSAQNPMSVDEIVGKFEQNAAAVLDAGRMTEIVDRVMTLDESPSAASIVELTMSARR